MGSSTSCVCSTSVVPVPVSHTSQVTALASTMARILEPSGPVPSITTLVPLAASNGAPKALA